MSYEEIATEFNNKPAEERNAILKVAICYSPIGEITEAIKQEKLTREVEEIYRELWQK